MNRKKVVGLLFGTALFAGVGGYVGYQVGEGRRRDDLMKLLDTTTEVWKLKAEAKTDAKKIGELTQAQARLEEANRKLQKGFGSTTAGKLEYVIAGSGECQELGHAEELPGSTLSQKIETCKADSAVMVRIRKTYAPDLRDYEGDVMKLLALKIKIIERVRADYTELESQCRMEKDGLHAQLKNAQTGLQQCRASLEGATQREYCSKVKTALAKNSPRELLTVVAEYLQRRGRCEYVRVPQEADDPSVSEGLLGKLCGNGIEATQIVQFDRLAAQIFGRQYFHLPPGLKGVVEFCVDGARYSKPK